MTLDRLLSHLDDIPHEVRSNISQVRYKHFIEKEAPGQEFGPPSFLEEYVNPQETRLREISDVMDGAVHEAFGDSDNSILIYVTGSLAKLEYIPGASDLDLLGVISTNSRLSMSKEAEIFDKFEKFVISRGAKTIGSFREPVSVSGMPLMRSKPNKPGEIERKKSFYTDSELVHYVGQEYEAAWAGFERASLLFESALLKGDSIQGNKIREDIDRTLYKLANDLACGKFPLVGYCLATFINKSGLLAKAAKIRKLHDDPKNITRETAKTMLSRIWTSDINLIALHIVYWSQLIAQPNNSAGDILDDLREPPLWKAIRILPNRMEFLDNSDECKTRLYQILGQNSTEVENVFDNLKKVRRHIHLRGSDDHAPLWYRFLQLMQVCKKLRKSKSHLPFEVITRIKAWNREMEDLLDSCAKITRSLCLADQSGTDGLTNFHHLVADHIHR